MERLLQRTARAKRQAVKKAAKQADIIRFNKSKTAESQRKVLNETNAKRLRQVRLNRTEDWERGALAPRRDVGEHADRYATMEPEEMSLPEKPRGDGLKTWHIVRGDRVVVTKGREKGRIGVVMRVSEDRHTVEVNDINVVDFFVPKWIPRPEGDERTIVAHSKAMPIDHVKLVYPLPNEETGMYEDVVIEKLRPIKRHYNKATRRWDKGERVVAGTSTIIPWPELPEDTPENNADDTLISDVADQTFQPSLLYPPMPMSVIDELRNKYSKFRTRHEEDFKQKMLEIDARDQRRRESPKTMRTPLQELADLRARKRAAQPKELSTEQLAKIGEVIALERARATNAVKVMAQ